MRLARSQALDHLLHLRHQVAAPNLAQRPVLCRRRAGRQLACGGGEGGRVIGDLSDRGAGPDTGGAPGGVVPAVGLEQDVGDIEEVGGAEPLAAGVVVAPALRSAGWFWLHGLVEERRHRRLVVGLHPARLVRPRITVHADSAGLLQQQLTDGERPGRLGPGRLRAAGGVVLDLLRDVLG